MNQESNILETVKRDIASSEKRIEYFKESLKAEKTYYKKLLRTLEKWELEEQKLKKNEVNE